MDRVIAVANLIGAPRTRHQTKEAGPIGDYTEKSNEAAATPTEAHPRMGAMRLVTKRGTDGESYGETGKADQPEIGTGGKSS